MSRPKAVRPAIPRDELRLGLGPQLRSARQARGLTLEQVATASDLSTGYISRLERDEVSPSVATLVTLCEVLGLRVGQLFETPTIDVVRAGEGRRVALGGQGVVEELLTPGSQGVVTVLRSVIEPGGSGGEDLYGLDADLECVYVLAGRLTLLFDGREERLEVGDSASFSARLPHTWRNDGAVTTEVLWVVAPTP